jgi:hypothetical protein
MHIHRSDRSEPDWGMWAGDTLHTAILIVTLERVRVGALAERFSTSGHFVLVCGPASVAEVLALAAFELVIVLDDVPPAVREELAATFAARLRPPCQVLDDGLSRIAPVAWDDPETADVRDRAA